MMLSTGLRAAAYSAACSAARPLLAVVVVVLHPNHFRLLEPLLSSIRPLSDDFRSVEPPLVEGLQEARPRLDLVSREQELAFREQERLPSRVATTLRRPGRRLTTTDPLVRSE